MHVGRHEMVDVDLENLACIGNSFGGGGTLGLKFMASPRDFSLASLISTLQPWFVFSTQEPCLATSNGSSDFTTQHGAARNQKGLPHHRNASQQPLAAYLQPASCLPAMCSLLHTTAC